MKCARELGLVDWKKKETNLPEMFRKEDSEMLVGTREVSSVERKRHCDEGRAGELGGRGVDVLT